VLRKSSIEEIKSIKEGFLKEKAELERKIDVIDTVLKIFEKDDWEESKIKTARVEISKLSDEEEKKKQQRKYYIKWRDKKKTAKEKQEKMNLDIEVEKGADISAAKKISKINYDDMG
jgi:hypothetical protein